MQLVILILAILVSSIGRAAAAGYDFDRKLSADSFDCGDIFPHPCGIESADDASAVSDSVVAVWTGDYNAEYGVLYADRSSDGGSVWGADITLIDQNHSISPRMIAASPADPSRVIIGWVTYAGLGMSLFLDLSYDWMRRFEYPRSDLRVARGVASLSSADVAIGSGDTLVAVFVREDTLWAKFSTLDAPSVWSDSTALYVSTNSMDQVDAEAGDGQYGVVWREKVNGLGAIRSLTFKSPAADSMAVEPLHTKVLEHRSRPIDTLERPAINTFVVSDNPTLAYDQPVIRSLAADGENPGAWWVAFHETRGRVYVDRRSATPTGEWGADLMINNKLADLPALAVAKEGGVEIVIAAYRLNDETTMFDAGEYDEGGFAWTDRESVSAGHSPERVNASSVVLLGANPLRFGVAYTPINHNGIGEVWFRGFTYSPN